MHRGIAILMLVFLAGYVAPDRVAYGPRAAANAAIEGFEHIRIYADTGRDLPDASGWLPVPARNEINYLVLSRGGASASAC